MYNPLALLNVTIVDKLIEGGCKWWVRQTYPRGIDAFDTETKNVFLVSYYNNKHEADVHYGIVSKRPGTCLYDITEEEDKRKLYVAATQPKGYKIFILQTMFEWEPPDQMRYKLQQYTRHQLGWKTQKGGRKINVYLNSNHGDDFMIVFRYEGMENSIPLREFEKKYLYV